MIRKFKNYTPKNNDAIPVFKKGDIVYCINNKYVGNLIFDTPYEINDIIGGKEEGDTILWYVYTIVGIPNRRYSEDRFISKTEYDAKKYNL